MQCSSSAPAFVRESNSYGNGYAKSIFWEMVILYWLLHSIWLLFQGHLLLHWCLGFQSAV